jgi:hypothetical protein
MHYQALIIEGNPNIPDVVWDILKPLREARRMINWQGVTDETISTSDPQGETQVKTPTELIAVLDSIVPPDFVLEPHHIDLRYRHVIKCGEHFILFFNEGRDSLEFDIRAAIANSMRWLDGWQGLERAAHGASITLRPFETALLHLG